MKDYIIRKTKSKRQGKYTYEYFDINGTKIEKSIVKNISAGLYIPPAYTDVKINMNRKDKVLAIGYDDKNRPQYIYNKIHTKRRSKKKFYHMIEFGESYNKIMRQVKRDLHTEGDSKNKQISMALMLVVECGIRIGNEKYRDENNSFGATTLEPRHFKIKGDVVSVDFIGKKGVRNTGKIRSKRLSRTIKMKKRTFRSSEPIFAYRNKSKWFTLKSTDVNRYLKKFGNFSAKNFRTWVANLSFITELMKCENNETITQRKNNITSATKIVAEKLNNTISVCKLNYIDPHVIDVYQNDHKLFQGSFKNASGKEDISERYIKLIKNK
jgi:DNA topoisomerase-1|tara:strand:+ start:3428 stop:4402 length:975 start_codon:yes stop_codon:yes gene_type:complete